MTLSDPDGYSILIKANLASLSGLENFSIIQHAAYNVGKTTHCHNVYHKSKQ